MSSLGEKVIGVLKARNFRVNVIPENSAVSRGLLIELNKDKRVICADTRVNPEDPDYTKNLKLIGGAYTPAAVAFGGNEEGFRRSARLLAKHGVTPAVHVDFGGELHDCKMFKLWQHGHLKGVHQLDINNTQLQAVLKAEQVKIDRLDGNAPYGLIVNTIPESTINKGIVPHDLAVDQWFAEKIGIGNGHLDIFSQAGEYLFKDKVNVQVIVSSKLARR